MTIKDKIRNSLKERILKTVVKGTPILVYEVPKPANYDELVKRVKKNHPELNK